ncbi:MAG TPA: DUF3429 domain-containing protein [Steroidobacteraceae bacterium]|nr:DUF3429 domain-containing protein [Steroidobacteraceae bacterium]HRX90050.1 DUF3429 domain-containing protein [Steroidobacteraceae bacterium]
MSSEPRTQQDWRATRVPRLADWAGYLGLMPFAAALLGVALAAAFDWREFALRFSIAYGAAILSFVGAVHFGLVVARRTPDTLAFVAGAIAPSLVAVAALLLGGQRGLALLTVGFGLFWLYENRRCSHLLPAAYVNLRRNLSLAVCALLALTMFAADHAGLR